jgi:hypothetical protein
VRLVQRREGRVLTLDRCWRVEHPSWSVVYRAPSSLGPRPDAASLEVTGHAVAVLVDRVWFRVDDHGVLRGLIVDAADLAALARVRVAVWPRNRAPFVDCSPERGDV